MAVSEYFGPQKHSQAAVSRKQINGAFSTTQISCWCFMSGAVESKKRKADDSGGENPDAPQPKRRRELGVHSTEPALVFLELFEKHADVLPLLCEFDCRWTVIRLNIIKRWFGVDTAADFPAIEDALNGHFGGAAEGEQHWSEYLQALVDPQNDWHMGAVHRAMLAGIASFSRFIGDKWVQHLGLLAVKARIIRRKIIPFAEMWKFKAAKPGTKLYKSVVDGIEEAFKSKSAKKM
jgi:hypothetical protein